MPSINTVDARLTRLSHSGKELLDTCPRKFQLTKLGKTGNEDYDSAKTITFAFGHSVGAGIQEYLKYNNRDKAILSALSFYDAPELWEIDEKAKKGFVYVIRAIDRFIALANGKSFAGFSVAKYNGNFACELGFRISIDGTYSYRGFVDCVLVHDTTGEVVVLEIKTTKNKQTEANYRNSFQAVGYSVVLDTIFPNLSSYSVLYIVYNTLVFEYDIMKFTKTHSDRVQWIQELLVTFEVLKLYNQLEAYPKNGKSCYNFYRECAFYGVCTLPTESLTVKESGLTLDADFNIVPDTTITIEGDYDIEVSITDLITTQLEKSSSEEAVTQDALDTLFETHYTAGGLVV